MVSHQPVLLAEILELLAPLEIFTFVDCTLGAGGHTKAVLKAHLEVKRSIGIEQDPAARSLAQTQLVAYADQLTIMEGNFRHLRDHLDALGIERVDAILLDIGVSSMQLDVAERGFSFQRDGPLDMRMDPFQNLTAAKLINEAPENELRRIFYEYGELAGATKLARCIVQARAERPIETTRELVDLLRPVVKPPRRGRIHPPPLLFQALRIAVNDELNALEVALPQAIDSLSPGGRLVVIAFHSLEDRLVKRAFRAASREWTEDPQNPYSGRKAITPRARLLTPSPIGPSLQEQADNPRSRSARLRAVERL